MIAKTAYDSLRLEIQQTVEEKGIEFVDLKFVDLFGTLQHITLPVEELGEGLFVDGLGFDGSSIRGFQAIHESDMLLVPDPKTMFVDPFMADPTLSFFCHVVDPETRTIYSRDARGVALRAETYLRASGIADVAYMGPELEFFIFDDVRFGQSMNKAFYRVDSVEGCWNTGRRESPNLGYKPRQKQGYFPAPPLDSYQDLRSNMVKVLRQVGVAAEAHHHEVASGGQSEIDIRFDSLLNMADQSVKYKYVIKNVARAAGKTVTFMPKPLFEDNGSGMHVHISLWKDERNLFYGKRGYAGLSSTALHFIGGLIRHAPALCAICAPTTNSYRRLVPGYEAPINLVYSQRNRSACIRIPMYTGGERAKRIEFRTPDPSSNPYLAFAAILMAGLDGIENQIDPPPPLDRDIYEYAANNGHDIQRTPSSLAEALDALEVDHEFLLKGEVFTRDLIEMYIALKRKAEVDYVRLRPHPAEFALYFDI